MKRAMFVGRWQPFHNGHKLSISKKLKDGVPVLICVRDAQPDEHNPFTTKETMHMLEVVFEGEDVVVMSVPDVESINCEKGSDYGIKEYTLPKKAPGVSVADIRSQLKEGLTEWRDAVEPRIQGIIHSLLLRN